MGLAKLENIVAETFLPKQIEIKRKEVAYCQMDAQMSEKYGITRDYY